MYYQRIYCSVIFGMMQKRKISVKKFPDEIELGTVVIMRFLVLFLFRGNSWINIQHGENRLTRPLAPKIVLSRVSAMFGHLRFDWKENITWGRRTSLTPQKDWTRLGRLICWPRQPNGLQGGGADSAVPDLPGNADLWVLFFQVMDLFNRQIIPRNEAAGIQSYDKKILDEFMPTFFPNPLQELFRRLRHAGRKGREGSGRQLQQSEQQAAG